MTGGEFQKAQRARNFCSARAGLAPSPSIFDSPSFPPPTTNTATLASWLYAASIPRRVPGPEDGLPVLTNAAHEPASSRYSYQQSPINGAHDLPGDDNRSEMERKETRLDHNARDCRKRMPILKYAPLLLLTTRLLQTSAKAVSGSERCNRLNCRLRGDDGRSSSVDRPSQGPSRCELCGRNLWSNLRICCPQSRWQDTKQAFRQEFRRQILAGSLQETHMCRLRIAMLDRHTNRYHLPTICKSAQRSLEVHWLADQHLPT